MTIGERGGMKALSSTPDRGVALARAVPLEAGEVTRMAASEPADLPDALAAEPFERVARLAAMALGTPLAAVTIAGEFASFAGNSPGAPDMTDWQSPAERVLCLRVIDSGEKLVLGGTRLDLRMSGKCLAAMAGVVAWAGFPVRRPDGRVAGALCVADHLPRNWSGRDIEVLQTLAQVAGREVALQAALRRGAERAALAQTLQESLLPPRLPEIPGLQVAARYAAGGTAVEVLGDFYDVFPSVRGSWGMVVGDVCGKGVPAAKSTAPARYTLRAEAHRQTQPSLILSALNQALLNWMTDDPRFLTAIYATIRPTLAGASVRISSGGHPLALVRRAGGRVHAAGQPGTLLGLLARPELHDSRLLLRAGDSLVLFTDGVTEARSSVDRDLYGDERLRDLIATLRDMSADGTAEAIQQALLAFTGGKVSDDTVVLVLIVPSFGAGPAARARGRLACRPAAGPGDRSHDPPQRQRHPGAGLTRARGRVRQAGYCVARHRPGGGPSDGGGGPDRRRDPGGTSPHWSRCAF
ncbi:MAG: PP2C family protein-serine/threonine phosphatase [Streptosporangiaceae bacterium]